MKHLSTVSFRRTKAVMRALGLMVIAFAASGAEFFVSPYGSPYGDGSKPKPWDLKTALAHPSAVKPGDTIWMLEGSYYGTFVSKLTGTAVAPIKVRQLPGAQATIDSNSGVNIAVLKVEGGYTWFQDFEITNSFATRVIATPGSNPPDRRGNSIDVYGPGTKVINLVIHDTGQGIGLWSQAVNSEAYGNLVYNNGWWAPDRGHGHGFYAQNATGTQTQRDNIVLQQFGLALQAYGSSAAFINNIIFDGNVYSDSGVLVGGSTPAKNIQFSNNMTYRTGVTFGYDSQANNGLSVTNNYLAGGVNFKWWKNVQLKGNTLSSFSSQSNNIGITLGTVSTLADYTIDSNTHLEGVRTPDLAWVSYPVTGGAVYNLAQWKALGKDLNGTEIKTGLKRPRGVYTNLKVNQYDPNRSRLVVYNWDSLPSVDVSLASAGFAMGDEYEIVNAYDYYGSTIKGIYSGSPISVPMTGWQVAKPIGYDQTLAPSPFPVFGVFIIRRSVAVQANVDLEAEKAVRSSPMLVSANGTASGGQLVFTPSSNAGTLGFTFDVPMDGSYIVWCRVKAPSYAQNSFFVSTDGGAEDVYDAVQGKYSSNWQWDRVSGRNGGTTERALDPKIFNWKTGKHVLRFRGREAYTYIDKIVVTNDPSFKPQ